MNDNRNKILQILLEYFSEEDLRNISFDLNIDFENFSGSTKAEKSLSLINYLYRRNRLQDLLDAGKRIYPTVKWPISEMEVIQPIQGSQLRELRKLINDYFNPSELRDLCFDLGIDYENLPGDVRAEKTRELVAYCNRTNQISDLVAFLRRMRPKVNWSSVYSVPLPEELPTETLEELAEAKLILVGDGEVGKTSLVNRLVHNKFNIGENATPGVAITKWFIDLPHQEIQKARLNIWDFGGQGSMHATHPYFFSRRAVYLVVVNVRKNKPDARAEYWLRLIRSYVTEAPIIVVSNKIDQFPQGRLDEHTLQRKYSVFDFVRTSCAKGTGISELRGIIATAVCTFDDISVKTPSSFIRLKQALENMIESQAESLQDTMRLSEFEELCDEKGVEPDQRDGFLRRLNDLGILLYFGDDMRLDSNVVLNPYWVTKGIYQFINDKNLSDAGGKLKLDQVRKILPRNQYPSDKAMYIIEMMCKFELCFPMNENHTSYLLPDLLPPERPELPAFDYEDALKFQFEYPVWQGVTLTRLLVRLSQNLIENAYWRNGALLNSLDKLNRALVIVDEADRRLRIWVDGKPTSRRNLLNRIREELNVIHGNQRDQIKEWVITPQGGEVNYQLLVNLEVKGTMTYDVLIDNKLIELNVKELLNGVRAETLPDPVRLKELITKHLSLNEIDELCFRFDIKLSLDDIEGDGKDAKARNLVRRFERRLQMPKLMSILRTFRSDVAWI